MADAKSETKYALTLTEEEARWLRDIMQNPLHGETLHDEPPFDAAMRQEFWAALLVLEQK